MNVFRAGGTVAAVLMAALPAAFSAPSAAQVVPLTVNLTLGSQLNRLKQATVPLRGSHLPTNQLYSTNWGGFIDGVTASGSSISSDGATFSSVNTSWKVPSLQSSPRNSVAASWTGLGGVIGSGGLLQAGSIEEMSGPRAEYLAFIEDYPNPPLQIRATVKAGDQMSTTVALTNGMWTVDVTDTTQGWTTGAVNIASVYSSDGYTFVAPNQQSAEWIMEDPTCGSSLCTFANVTATTFSPVQDVAPTAPASRTPLETILVSSSGTPEVTISPSSIGSASSTDGTYLAFTVAKTGSTSTSGGGGKGGGPGHHHGPRK